MDFEAVIDSFSKSCGIADLTDCAAAIIVAFSGGADSALLLSYLSEKYGSVAAAHFNHNLRGEESQRDNDFCREFCSSRNIRFFEGAANISAIAENTGESLEECGRRERYAFFDRCRKELSLELSCIEDKILIATAHNSDDNLETVIFNLARGSGLRGLRGIAPVRDGKYIRPLLALTSEEVRTVCAERGIPYVVDSTNLDDDYTRNRIRHRIVPELERINPAVRRNVARSSQLISLDNDHIESPLYRLRFHRGSYLVFIMISQTKSFHTPISMR